MSKTAPAPNSQTPIKLQHPYTTDAGVPIEQINVRGITVREMRHAQEVSGGNELQANYIMLATSCDLVLEDLDKMMAIDFKAVQDRFFRLNFGRTTQQMASDGRATG